jgi:putative acetyltransferase
MFTFREATPADRAAIEHVVFTVLAEYGLQGDPGATDADLADIAAHYQARGGVFRVVEGTGAAVLGCGGLYPLGGDEAELRKMYLLPEARGHGLGRRLLDDLLGEARARGFRRVVLETASVLREAIALYTKVGFVPTTRGHLARE